LVSRPEVSVVVEALVIRVEEVDFRYQAASHDVISGLNIDLHRGEVLAVLGANGSGKSTLALLLNGLLHPTSGQIEVDGILTTEAGNASHIRSLVGIVLQSPDDQIVATVVEEDVAFGPENLGIDPGEIRARVDAALEAVGLTGLERREPHLLSGGQKQRLAIAGILALQPAFLVLDEPTSMLDPSGRRDVLGIIEKLRTLNHGIVHITHHVEDIATSDRVLVLDKGAAVFCGTPEEFLQQERFLESWGVAVPPIGVLAGRLRDLGVPVPATAMTAERIVGAL